MVEFALVAALFFTVLLGVIEMGRMLWTWNAAVEATRYGARLAVVCDIADGGDGGIIENKMRSRLSALAPNFITISYLPSGCTDATCRSVQVSLAGYTHNTIIPFVPLSVTMPPFATTLRREFMQSAGNPICS